MYKKHYIPFKFLAIRMRLPQKWYQKRVTAPKMISKTGHCKFSPFDFRKEIVLDSMWFSFSFSFKYGKWNKSDRKLALENHGILLLVCFSIRKRCSFYSFSSRSLSLDWIYKVYMVLFRNGIILLSWWNYDCCGWNWNESFVWNNV